MEQIKKIFGKLREEIITSEVGEGKPVWQGTLIKRKVGLHAQISQSTIPCALTTSELIARERRRRQEIIKQSQCRR
uniref:Uncharacterized protein n=1 Tax=Arion vulgaris TaxID=1028688 RepID=A0A0B7AVZ5_9EUPU